MSDKSRMIDIGFCEYLVEANKDKEEYIFKFDNHLCVKVEFLIVPVVTVFDAISKVVLKKYTGSQNSDLNKMLYKIFSHKNIWEDFLDECDPVVGYDDFAQLAIHYTDVFGGYTKPYTVWIKNYKLKL